MKVTIGTTDGNTYQTEIEESAQLAGKKIGKEFDGGIVGLEGYTLKITGGTDQQGFPMRRSIEGIDEDEDGVRRRQSVRGNTVSGNIEQLNTTVVEEGSKSVEELLGEDEE